MSAAGPEPIDLPPVNLACPTCRVPLRITTWSVQCERCHVAAPRVHDFVMWNETFRTRAEAEGRGAEIADESSRYRELLERKSARQLYEPYAWFRPFNESTRAIEVFRELLTESVPRGAPILDLWCRTGWTGELLASWFPDNPVVSLWEGDSDTLGYQGYLWWLGRQDRAPNLTFMFARCDEPLPFPDQFFGLVHGLDTLHRYPPYPLLGECLRVALQGAPLMFPHVHLTNSEPEPFFERGCTQLHGEQWGASLDPLCAQAGLRAWVVSERDLYLADQPLELVDNRSTPHYNGFIALGPPSWQGRQLTPAKRVVDKDSFVFLNPLLCVDSAIGKARVDPDGMSGTVGYMTARHQVAVQALLPVVNQTLNSFECQVLARGPRAQTIGELASELGTTPLRFLELTERLVAAKAIQIEQVSPGMARLQSHYQTLRPEQGWSFALLWNTLSSRYGSRDILRGSDGSTFSFADVDALVQAVRQWLHRSDLAAGQRLGLLATGHVEYLVTVWACWLSGVEPVLLPPGLADGLIDSAIEDLRLGGLACDHESRSRTPITSRDLPTLIFDRVDLDPVEPDSADLTGSGPQSRNFADVMGELLDMPLLSVVESVQERGAVIFTSGSSGRAKAVQLSMSSLLHSATVMSDVLTLSADDKLLSLGSMCTMSGLRNPALAALVGGATIIVDTACATSTLAIVEACRRHVPTVLIASPTLVDQLAALETRIRPRDLASLSRLATTADRLSPASKAAVEQRYGLQVIDYYGLTETGGVVVVAAADVTGELGVPVGAAVEVHVDERRADPGVVGEIRVSGPGTMRGYLGDVDGVRVDAGWVYTGDLGVVHEDGSISLVGRRSDQLKRRTGEIFPHEAVVAVAGREPGVDHAAVRQDSDTRQIVLRMAVDTAHVLTVTSDAIRSTLRSQLGAEGVPDQIEVITE